MLRSIDASALSIPFKTSFRHASAERSSTQTIWVSATDSNGVIGFGEGCPREYVTTETLATAQEFIARHKSAWLDCIHDIQSLSDWVSAHKLEIDANPAAWTAVELSILDVLGKAE